MVLKIKTAIIFLAFLCFMLVLPAQNQKIADSLYLIYQQNKLEGFEKLELLRNLSFYENNDRNLAITYAEELIALATLEKNNEYIIRGYLQKGTKSFQMGDRETALIAYFKAAEIAIADKNYYFEGVAYLNIADLYSVSDNHDNAEIYYQKAIKILREANDDIYLASALLNAGDEFFKNKKYDNALQYFEESGKLFKENNYPMGIAYNLGNLGKVYHAQGKFELAKSHLARSIAILKEIQDDYGISDYAIYLSDVFEKQHDLPAAFTFANTSLELSEKQGLKEQMSAANLQLSELYELQGNGDMAYKYYKAHIGLRDSINNIANVRQLANLRTNFELSQKQTEVDLLKLQKNNQRIVTIATGVALFFIALLAIGLFRRYRFIRRTNEIIEIEKKRSESLLLNILPEETANELKEKGKVRAKKFESASVMFTDFIEFTHAAEKLSPEKLVKSIDFYFSKFDEIIENHGLEKIKTIGDAYMCASGLHTHKENHAQNMVNAAFEIIEFVNETRKARSKKDMNYEIRIGINSGPLVAGVVGTKKFAYDIWGDTVNVASRMESMSQAGKVNISENTYALVKNAFDCEYRGRIKVKNRGMMKMYFVNEPINPSLKKEKEASIAH